MPAKGRRKGVFVKKEVIASKIKKRFIKKVYINREFSWLLFNSRVLQQADDPTNPLLEQCRFLTIFGSNLDEFFMVRVGSLVNDSRSDPDEQDDKTNLTAEKQIDGILAVVRRLYSERDRVYRELCGRLSKAGVKILSADDLTPRQDQICREFFFERIMPYTSVVVLDSKHPMIRFENMRDYMLCDLEKNGHRMIGVLYVNAAADKLVPVGSGKKLKVIPTLDIVRHYGHLAFIGYTVKSRVMVRVTRNADVDTRMSDAVNLPDYSYAMRKTIERRSRLGVVRVELDSLQSPLRSFVLEQLKTEEKYCIESPHFFNYSFLNSIGKLLPEEKSVELKYAPYRPAVPSELREADSLIDHVLEKDMFLSYPYDSMNPICELLDQCARDRRVVSIMITIYRLAGHSRIVDALLRASENGKQVTAVIELAARFDEESNLQYAEKLRDAGCNVFYGMGNYKVHSKIISIVLNDGGNIRYITHLGTGNYNESTAKQYTDLNIVTADEEIGEDATAFFRNIAIGNASFQYKKLLVAPETLKEGILRGIQEETVKARNGGEGRIVAKMNSMTDRPVMDALIEAGKAGVKIDLIIRGICCLLPGVPGETENICVRSIVGRFLEHSRIYSFGTGKDRKVYISSADMMTRNTDKRVEIAAPVEDASIRKQIFAYLDLLLADNVKARVLGPDGVYRPVERKEGDADINSQEACILLAKKR